MATPCRLAPVCGLGCRTPARTTPRQRHRINSVCFRFRYCAPRKAACANWISVNTCSRRCSAPSSKSSKLTSGNPRAVSREGRCSRKATVEPCVARWVRPQISSNATRFSTSANSSAGTLTQNSARRASGRLDAHKSCRKRHSRSCRLRVASVSFRWEPCRIGPRKFVTALWLLLPARPAIRGSCLQCGARGRGRTRWRCAS